MSRHVVTTYFEALGRRDPDAMAEMWAPDGVGRIASQGELVGPGAIRAYFTELFGAFPDLALRVESIVAEGDNVAVHWTATGTMTGPLRGIEPTGARVRFEGMDLVRVAGGKIVRNDALPDGLAIARDIGVMPRAGSATEQRLYAAFNAGAKATRRAIADRDLERVADGVWLLRGGIPRTMNVYLLEDAGGGVTLFDAGIRSMTRAIAEAAAALGGINRIVLSHADADHRGGAPGLRVPTSIHPDDEDAAGEPGPFRGYHRPELLGIPARWAYPTLMSYWDGGPVEIAGTVAEGDDVSGFEVVHLPGHAPGLIGLFRHSDRLALSSDCAYFLDIETSRKGPPRVPHEAFNQDTGRARESIRKLAALDPSSVWPAHGDPIRVDVRAQLEAAAAA